MDHPVSITVARCIILLPLVGAAINFLAGAWLQKTFGKRAISRCRMRRRHPRFHPGRARVLRDARAAARTASCSTTCGAGFHSAASNLDIAFWLDPLSMIMTLIITGVGGLIHIYSTGYMHDDDAYWRFFGWLNLFTFAMLILVLGDNLWLMFVGWEGVGLCSFALIGFWYKVYANTDRRQQGLHRQSRRRSGLRGRALYVCSPHSAPSAIRPSSPARSPVRAVARRDAAAISACRWSPS